MRGSGDIHAAYDHGATLTRQDDGSVLLCIEHRTAASPEPMGYRLVSKGDGGMTFEFVDVALEEEESSTRSARTRARVRASEPESPRLVALSLRELVLQAMKSAGCPVSQCQLRKQLKVRNESLTELLHALAAEGCIESLGRMKGWRLRDPAEGALPPSQAPATDPAAADAS